MDNVTKRKSQIDNIRFFLIFLVVFGHFLELFPGFSSFYKVIYSFHMPAFFFISGMFARFDRKKIIKHLLIPYFIFQTSYIIFDHQSLTYVTPFWLMWFLLVLFFYYSFLPLLPAKNLKNGVCVFCGSIVVALLIGYDKEVGNYLSLSRFFVFAPFFIAGYYRSCFKNKKFFRLNLSSPFSSMRAFCILFLLGLFVILADRFLVNYLPSFEILWGAQNYNVCHCLFWWRFFLQILAISSIGLLFFIFPKKRILWITRLGRNTMSIYLLHGFILLLIKRWDLFHYSPYINLSLAFLYSILIILLFGNSIVGKFFHKAF